MLLDRGCCSIHPPSIIFSCLFLAIHPPSFGGSPIPFPHSPGFWWAVTSGVLPHLPGRKGRRVMPGQLNLSPRPWESIPGRGTRAGPLRVTPDVFLRVFFVREGERALQDPELGPCLPGEARDHLPPPYCVTGHSQWGKKQQKLERGM